MDSTQMRYKALVILQISEKNFDLLGSNRETNIALEQIHFAYINVIKLSTSFSGIIIFSGIFSNGNIDIYQTDKPALAEFIAT